MDATRDALLFQAERSRLQYSEHVLEVKNSTAAFSRFINTTVRRADIPMVLRRLLRLDLYTGLEITALERGLRRSTAGEISYIENTVANKLFQKIDQKISHLNRNIARLPRLNLERYNWHFTIHMENLETERILWNRYINDQRRLAIARALNGTSGSGGGNPGNGTQGTGPTGNNPESSIQGNVPANNNNMQDTTLTDLQDSISLDSYLCNIDTYDIFDLIWGPLII